MNKNQVESSHYQQQQWQDLTLAQYVQLRNGVPLGDAGSLRNMLRRSFAFLFTPRFFLLGVGAVLSRIIGMDLSRHSWWVGASVNLVYLVFCLALTLAAGHKGFGHDGR